jgi:hypothetical protein
VLTDFAQSKSDTTIVTNRYFNVFAIDTLGPIFSLTMTGDTSRLKPIDTVYYTMSYDMYREIKYKYLIDKKPQILIVRSYTNHHNWILSGIQLIPYYPRKQTN